MFRTLSSMWEPLPLHMGEAPELSKDAWDTPEEKNVYIVLVEYYNSIDVALKFQRDASFDVVLRMETMMSDSIQKKVVEDCDQAMEIYLQRSGGMSPIGECVVVYEEGGPSGFWDIDARQQRKGLWMWMTAGGAILC